MHNLNFILIVIFLGQTYGFKFTIVHNNDIHARYDPVDAYAEPCKKGDDEKGLCYGGMARVATAIDQERRAKHPVIFLNAGDIYQGTPWYTIYKGPLAAELLNMLAPDAVALGNHEFDDNIAGLMPFLNAIKYPVVSCNLNLAKVPELQNAKQLSCSTVITKFDTKIGIIGYLTPDTKDQVQANELEYYQEISSINYEANKLTQQGVNIIIALGHSGYEMDQQIAMNCPLVDVVVGGHSHTFLYSGDQPDNDKPMGPYPTVVRRPNGMLVPVVQAYAFTKYLGKISLEFDKGGHLTNFGGRPILLDKKYEGRADVKALLDSKRGPIDALETAVLGISLVHLSGDNNICRREECNLGNLIADSFVYARVLDRKSSQYWTDASIAFINGGGIRASIIPGMEGAVTGADIAKVMPFSNSLYYTKIRGKYLIDNLEHSGELRLIGWSGGFLQMSGIRVVYNYSLEKGSRITSLIALCAECKVPVYEQVDSEKYYGVIVPKFLLGGGDGHTFIDPDKPDTKEMSTTDRDAFTKYFQDHKVVYAAVEKRQSIVQTSISVRVGAKKIIIFISMFVNGYLYNQLI